MKNNEAGFTLIEILMAVLLIAILAGIGITQFVDFSGETKNAATRANLSILRKALTTQFGQERLRCRVTGSAWPSLTNFNANDITNDGTPCAVADITSASDRQFVSGSIPVNPWGGSVGGPTNTIAQCTLVGCTDKSTQCVGGGARAATDDGWCYNVATGEIWANSAHNPTTDEYSF